MLHFPAAEKQLQVLLCSIFPMARFGARLGCHDATSQCIAFGVLQRTARQPRDWRTAGAERAAVDAQLELRRRGEHCLDHERSPGAPRA